MEVSGRYITVYNLPLKAIIQVTDNHLLRSVIYFLHQKFDRIGQL